MRRWRERARGEREREREMVNGVVHQGNVGKRIVPAEVLTSRGADPSPSFNRAPLILHSTFDIRKGRGHGAKEVVDLSWGAKEVVD